MKPETKQKVRKALNMAERYIETFSPRSVSPVGRIREALAALDAEPEPELPAPAFSEADLREAFQAGWEAYSPYEIPDECEDDWIDRKLRGGASNGTPPA